MPKRLEEVILNRVFPTVSRSKPGTPMDSCVGLLRTCGSSTQIKSTNGAPVNACMQLKRLEKASLGLGPVDGTHGTSQHTPPGFPPQALGEACEGGS
eukprot:scaffold1564_cov590-Pavlova_lutheri.AAC.1